MVKAAVEESGNSPQGQCSDRGSSRREQELTSGLVQWQRQQQKRVGTHLRAIVVVEAAVEESRNSPHDQYSGRGSSRREWELTSGLVQWQRQQQKRVGTHLRASVLVEAAVESGNSPQGQCSGRGSSRREWELTSGLVQWQRQRRREWELTSGLVQWQRQQQKRVGTHLRASVVVEAAVEESGNSSQGQCSGRGSSRREWELTSGLVQRQRQQQKRVGTHLRASVVIEAVCRKEQELTSGLVQWQRQQQKRVGTHLGASVVIEAAVEESCDGWLEVKCGLPGQLSEGRPPLLLKPVITGLQMTDGDKTHSMHCGL